MPLFFQDTNGKHEDIRIKNEKDRISDEKERIENEKRRVKYENIRVIDEESRMEEEKIRRKGYNDFITAMGDSNLEGTIEAEVIGARGEFENLRGRLGNFDSHLSDNEQKEMKRGLIQSRRRKAIMTLVDDDGREHVYRLLKPVIEELQVPITSCLVTNKMESGDKEWLNLNQVMELKNTGLFELCSHTANHAALATLTEEQQREEMRVSKKWLRKYGLCDDLIVYPYGSVNDITRKVAREFYRAGVWIADNNAVNYPPFATYYLQRVYIEGAVELCKQKIDEAIENDGWVIFGMHCHYQNWRAEDLKTIVNYAKSRGIEIVSLSEGLNRMGNILDVGDTYFTTTPNTIGIDCSGKTFGMDIGKVIYRLNGYYGFSYTPSTLPSYYDKGKCTIVNINSASALNDGFPEGKAGTLFTYRISESSDVFTYQEYWIARTNKRYYRNAYSTTSWNPFELLQGICKITIDVPEIIVPANSFKDTEITIPKLSPTESLVFINPTYDIEPALIVTPLILSSSKLTIRVRNVFSSERTITARKWKVGVIF